MWSKFYVGVLVVIIIIFFNMLNTALSRLEKEYKIEENYRIPVRCMSVAMCGLTGNIFLLFLIYLLIPNEYYDSILKTIDPRQIHKVADNVKAAF